MDTELHAGNAKEHYWLQHAPWYTVHYGQLGLEAVRTCALQHFEAFDIAVQSTYGEPERPFHAPTTLVPPPFHDDMRRIYASGFRPCSVDRPCCAALVETGAILSTSKAQEVIKLWYDQRARISRAICCLGECGDARNAILADEFYHMEDTANGRILAENIYDFRRHMKVTHSEDFDTLQARYNCYDQAMQANQLREFFSTYHIHGPGEHDGKEIYCCLAGDCGKENAAVIETYELNGQLQAHLLDEHDALLEVSETVWLDTRLAALNDWSAKLLETDQEAPDGTSSPSAYDSDEEDWAYRAPGDPRGLQGGYFPDPAQNPDVDLRNQTAFHNALNRKEPPVSKATWTSYMGDTAVLPNNETAIWRKVKRLGNGSYGVASLWILYSQVTGTVIDSLVIKDVFYASNQRVNTGHYYWEDGGSDGQRRPYEGVIQKRLTDIQERYSTVLHHFRSYAGNRLTRFYMEYAPCGDLHNAAHNSSASITCKGLVPEGMVWSVFYAVAHTLLSMYQGDEDDSWAAAMHRDIKDDNIFLVEARDGFSKRMGWPTAVMGDYGLSALYPTDNPGDNAEGDDAAFETWLGPHLARLGRIGTPGHIAPESLCKDFRLVHEGHDGVLTNVPGPHWDVYGAAITILRLMFPKESYSDEWKEIDLTDDGGTAGRAESQIHRLYIHEEYSNELRDLVKQCLVYNHTKRPTLEALLERTKIGRDSWAGKPWKFGSFEFRPVGPDEGLVGRLYRAGDNVRDMDLHHKPGHTDMIDEELFRPRASALTDPRDDIETPGPGAGSRPEVGTNQQLPNGQGIQPAAGQPVQPSADPEPLVTAVQQPQPVIPQPVILQPVIPQPVIPQPVILQPVIPQPVIPQPVIPQPVAEYGRGKRVHQKPNLYKPPAWPDRPATKRRRGK